MLVGLVCAAANYAVMLGVDWLGGHYLLGMLAAFVIVTPMAYLLHSVFTFAEPFSRKAFIRFAITVIAAYPIATAMMIVLCSGVRLRVAIAYPIAVAGIFGWNFVTAHWAILPRSYLSGLPQKLPARYAQDAKRKQT